MRTSLKPTDTLFREKQCKGSNREQIATHGDSKNQPSKTPFQDRAHTHEKLLIVESELSKRGTAEMQEDEVQIKVGGREIPLLSLARGWAPSPRGGEGGASAQVSLGGSHV